MSGMRIFLSIFGLSLIFTVVSCLPINSSTKIGRTDNGSVSCINYLNTNSLIISTWKSAIVLKKNVSEERISNVHLSQNLLYFLEGEWRKSTFRWNRGILRKLKSRPHILVCGIVFTSCLGYEKNNIKEKSDSSSMQPNAWRPGKRNVMAEPFAREVWISIGAILVLISISLHFVLRKEERVVHFGSEAPLWETSEVLLVTLGALCQQGSPRHPNTAAARTIFTFLFAFSVIAFTAYSASVVATLAPPVERTRNLWYTGQRRRFGFHTPEIFPTYEERTQSLLRGNVTLCTKFNQEHPSDLQWCVFVLQKWCQTGLIDDAMLNGTPESSPIGQGDDKIQEVVSITLEDAYPAITLLILGICSSIIIFLMEVTIHI